MPEVQQLDFHEAVSKPYGKHTVAFWATDPAGKYNILLDGKKILYAIPGLDCDHSIQVAVTSHPKISMCSLLASLKSQVTFTKTLNSIIEKYLARV